MLFYVLHSYCIDIAEIASNENTVSPQIGLKPTQEVINTFYDFNESIYGLDKTAQREISLQRFNELYKKIKVQKG